MACELKGDTYHGRNVAAAFGSAGDFAGILAEDAGTVRPMARAEESGKSMAVPASGKFPTSAVETVPYLVKTSCGDSQKNTQFPLLLALLTSAMALQKSQFQRFRDLETAGLELF